jgi:two-component system, LuxR family, response regulator FixJ
MIDQRDATKQTGDDMVFLVEDDEAVRDSLRLLLESYGLAVEDYGSVEEFTKSYRPQGQDCLILDHNLPGASGLDFLEARGAAAIDLPVILITGRGDPSARARALELGVAAYLEKPLDDQALIAAIRSAVTGH